MLNKYLDLAGERKNQCRMRITVILIVVGAIGIAPKGFEKRVEELEIKDLEKRL